MLCFPLSCFKSLVNTVDNFLDRFSVMNDFCLIYFSLSLPPNSPFTTFYCCGCWIFPPPLVPFSSLSTIYSFQKLKRLFPDEVSLLQQLLSFVCLTHSCVTIVFVKPTHHYPLHSFVRAVICHKNFIRYTSNVATYVVLCCTSFWM